MHKRAIIVTGGNPPSKRTLLNFLSKDDYIIGVDSGCNCLREYGIKPDIILGDLDSIDTNVIEYYMEIGIEILKYKPEKDYSDTDLGYMVAKEKGFNNILLFGGTGTRYDHALGNIGLLLKALRENIKIEMIDDNNKMFVVNSNTTFEGKYGELISFHALSDVVSNLNIYNAKYILRNYDMSLLEPRAICNEFLNENIEITFDSGIILVIFPID